MAKRIYKMTLATLYLINIIACNEVKKDKIVVAPQAATTAPTTTIEKVDTLSKPIANGEIGDTLFVSSKSLVTHYATEKEMKKWDKASPDFAESLADNLHYLDETMTAAKKLGAINLRTEKDNIVFIKDDGTRLLWTRGKKFDGWGAIAFSPNKAAKEITIVDAERELREYFK